jgi:putative endonuclease
MLPINNKGSDAERLAEIYLEGLGFKILARNWRHKHAEIDLIVTAEIGWVVFVEVKYRAKTQFGNPENFVTEKKLETMGAAIKAFMAHNEAYTNFRIDIVAIEGEGAEIKIRYFQDVI